MKRFFTLAALLVSMVSFAAPKPKAGRIIITNSDNSIIQVRVDGRSYNVTGQPMILNNLAGGRHQLQIFRIDRRVYGPGKSKPVLIYNAPVYVDQSFIVDVNVGRTGKVSIGKSMVINNGNDRYNQRDDWYADNRNGYGGNRNDYDRYEDKNKGAGHNQQPKPSRPDRPGF